MVSSDFVADQIIQLSLAFAHFVVSVLQLLSELSWEQPQGYAHQLGRLKRVFHRLVPFASLLMMLEGLDPFGRIGLWPIQLSLIFSQNTTICIVVLVSVWVYHTVEAVYALMNDKPPRLVLMVLKSIVVICFLIANVVSVIYWSMGKDQNEISGVFLLWMSFTVLAMCSLLNMAVYVLHSRVDFFDRISFLDPGMAPVRQRQHMAVRKAMRRMRIIQIGGTSLATPIMVLLFTSGYEKLTDHSPVFGFGATTEHSYTWKTNLFFYVQLALLILATWLAWIPMTVCTRGLQSRKQFDDHYLDMELDENELRASVVDSVVSESRAYYDPYSQSHLDFPIRRSSVGMDQVYQTGGDSSDDDSSSNSPSSSAPHTGVDEAGDVCADLPPRGQGAHVWGGQSIHPSIHSMSLEPTAFTMDTRDQYFE